MSVYSASPADAISSAPASLWPPDSDTAFWNARATFDDVREAAAAFEVVDLYGDEAPEAPESDYFEPDAFDREWHAEQLALLESQRDDCLGLDLTLANLDSEISSLRRSLVLHDVAEFLSRNSLVGHDCREDGATC